MIVVNYAAIIRAVLLFTQVTMFNRQVLGLLCLLCWMAGTLAQSCDCADQAFKTECDKATG